MTHNEEKKIDMTLNDAAQYHPVRLQAQLIARVMPRRLDRTSALFRGASESFVARLMVRMARHVVRAVPGQVSATLSLTRLTVLRPSPQAPVIPIPLRPLVSSCMAY